MEFCRDRVFTAVNADELRAGDKVIVGSSLLELKTNVECNRRYGNIVEIGGECSNRRFTVDDVDGRGETCWELAYLVERKENCTNCEEAGCYDCVSVQDPEAYRCEYYKPITKQKAEKYADYNCEEARKAYAHAMTNACPNKYYRPFKDTDELIKVWNKKFYLDFKPSHDPLTMPLIWVRYKGEAPNDMCLINGFNGDEPILIGDCWMSLETLFSLWEFLDGTPCGVKA